MLIVLCAVLGLVVGSFLNVVIWRVPRGESVVRPRSACPGCGHRIRTRDNVPLVSWLLLRGRCRDCGMRISVRYPLVEVATAVLFALVALRFGAASVLPAYLYLAAIGLALAVIDLDTHRLPNAIVLPSYIVLGALLAIASVMDDDIGALARAGVGGVAMWGAFLLMAVIYPSGMGFGDVKLAGVLGAGLAWIGWGALVVGFFVAFVIGAGVAMGLIAARRATRRSGVPFGPAMVAGAAIGVGWGEQLWSAYLGLF